MIDNDFSQEEKEQITFLHFQIELMEQTILEKYKMPPQLMIDALINKTISLIKAHAPSKIEGLGFLLDSISQAIHSIYEKNTG